MASLYCISYRREEICDRLTGKFSHFFINDPNTVSFLSIYSLTQNYLGLKSSYYCIKVGNRPCLVQTSLR